MKTFNIHTMLKGLLCSALLLAATACSDDHFDINDGGSFSATRTIWQNIQDEPQLSDLAAILQRVPVYKSVSDKKSAVLYSELLNQPQTFTMWAPVNGTYDAQSYLNRLDEAEAIADDSLRAVAKFRIGYQFVMNHLARFNYESTSTEQEIYLLNSKRAYYNSGAATFNNIPLLPGYESIPSSNGTLHILNGCSPFYKNMMENITEDYPALINVLYSQNEEGRYIYQQNSLDRNRSIEGAMDNEGNMVYVDTIWSGTNNLISSWSLGTDISNEDSTYLAIVPATDEAFNTALGKLTTLFKYGQTYWTDWDNELFRYKKTETVSQAMIDSLAYDRAYSRLFSSMYITPSACGFDMEQPVDSAEFINYILHADTVRTVGDFVLRHPLGTVSDPDVDVTNLPVNPIFEGKEPRRLSNGYVFELDQEDLDPRLLWIPRINFQPQSSYYVMKVDKGTTTYGEGVNLTGQTRNPDIEGYIQDDSYTRFQADGTGSLRIFIALPNVLSTSYRVKLVLAPNFTRLSDGIFKNVPVLDEETGEPLVDEETGEPITEEVLEEVVSMFDATLYYDTHTITAASDPRNTIAQSKQIYVDQNEVKEYVIFDKVTFDKCYYALPTESSSYPYLLLEIPALYQRILGKNNNALNVVRVILEPLPEE